MSLPIITPAEGQPIHALMRELEALGGIRHQDFKVISGLARPAYQVTPELYDLWLEAGGAAETPTDLEPGTPATEGADGDTASDEAKNDDSGSSTPATEAATEETTPAEKDGAEAEPAQAEKTATTKTATTKTATTKRGARN